MTDVADFDYLTHKGRLLQVESAIRDGDGYTISTAYPRKVDILTRPGDSKVVSISHGLGKAPSAVSLYQVHGTASTGISYEKIEADMVVTDDTITITFTELPPIDPYNNDVELLVRSLI